MSILNVKTNTLLRSKGRKEHGRDLVAVNSMDGGAADITGFPSGTHGVNGETEGLQCLKWNHGLQATQKHVRGMND